MKSRASIAGHPIHPMLVSVPIGLAVWTLIADIVYLATDKDAVWYDIAYWSGLAFWISALIAALPGLVDLMATAIHSDARVMALSHMTINVVVVGLFLVASLLMWDHGATGGTELTIVIVLHVLGVGLLGLSGWLGGEMVYRHHLGIIPDSSQLEAEEERIHTVRPAPTTHTR